MNCLWVTLLVAAHALILCTASPAGHSDGVVEIERQKLIKFPEDAEQQQRQDRPDRPDPSIKQKKEDEAKRILEEIEKINQSLGYRKKQTEQPNRVPPILDSSQYLFPKPAYQPFHAQNHQFPGSNGELLLVPSIRAIKFDRKFAADAPNPLSHNAPAKRKSAAKNTASEAPSHPHKAQFYFRPNQVQIPAPQNAAEQQQLPTHFVIPVRLYKMNKDEYVKQFSPQQYRVNGYKIVGDIDNFYGKAKKSSKPSKHKNGNKASSKQSSPKYHLFFLPREVALNEDSSTNHARTVPPPPSPSLDAGSREEKLANRPFKVQTTATSGNSAAGSNVTSSTQIVRKRIIPKPLRNKETNINSLATQNLADGSSASSATNIHIAPPSAQNAAPSSSAGSSPIGSTINSGIINAQQQAPNPNKNGYSLLNNRPNIGFLMNSLRPSSDNSNGNANTNSNTNTNTNNNNFGLSNTTNATTANAIKMAFQNIFKFPFRQDTKPSEIPNTNDESAANLESVPLQIPQKTFPLFSQPFYQSDVAASQAHVQAQLPHQISTQYYDKDYKWDDDGNNSAPDEDNDSAEGAEKQFFGHHHQQQQETQKEALKQGGIIIQKLKVRKGGIAIAGPGGVATAGSGGTAIVGPGGYALTHPRSLTIAGPGAKVIAIPADVDLKDALQRTNLSSKSFPREGKIVATGPTVYYSPATGTATDV